MGSTSRQRAWLRWPWWLQVVAVHGATRVWSTVVLLVAAAGQPDSYWGPGPPDYAVFTGLFWDASWYREIAVEGYPVTLPRDADGTVQQNAWAFFPLFPWLARSAMAVTGGTWEVVAPALALLLGFGAALVLDRLVQHGVDARAGRPQGRRVALGTVLLVGLAPAGPVLQVAYSESTALLLVCTVLLLLVRRRYLWAVPAVLALGLARAVALPLAVVVLVHLVSRARAHRAGRDRLGRGEVVRIVSLGAASALAGVAWPAVAGVVTGVPDAYVRTQAAWRGTFSSAPLVPWFEMAEYLFGSTGGAVLAAVVAVTGALALSRAAAAAGQEVRAWGVAYLGYLLLVAFPQTSLIRFLLLAFPLATAAVVLARRRGTLVALVGASALCQLGWTLWLWQVTTATAWPP